MFISNNTSNTWHKYELIPNLSSKVFIVIRHTQFQSPPLDTVYKMLQLTSFTLRSVLLFFYNNILALDNQFRDFFTIKKHM
ncbi:hypothetical protein D3C76_1226630 [compost metagenome]